MKKVLSLLLITAFVFSLCACTGKVEKTSETASPEITGDTDGTSGAPLSTSPASDNMNEVIEDVSAYPSWYLGKRPADLQGMSFGSSTLVNGQPDCLLNDENHNQVFNEVFFLMSEGAYDEDGTGPSPDSLFVSVYTSKETELYPGLAPGKSFNEYEQVFPLSGLAYSEDFCCYFSTADFIVNGRDVTAYLFFYDKISLCTSILMTIDDELNFSTISVPENERELYPVLYIGRNALSMKAKYGDDLYYFDPDDTPEKKSALLIKPDEEFESEKVAETSRVKNVIITLPDYDIIPGLKKSSTREEYYAAFRKTGESPVPSKGEGTAYLGTLFIAGYFVECFAVDDIEDETKFESVRLLCKQLFE